ncbi:hypothetical protein D9M71_17010 [compost metagenome]
MIMVNTREFGPVHQLHCDRNRLTDVLKRIYNALRRGGVCYMSFKYGSTDREKDGRSFTDLNEV